MNIKRIQSIQKHALPFKVAPNFGTLLLSKNENITFQIINSIIRNQVNYKLDLKISNLLLSICRYFLVDLDDNKYRECSLGTNLPNNLLKELLTAFFALLQSRLMLNLAPPTHFLVSVERRLASPCTKNVLLPKMQIFLTAVTGSHNMPGLRASHKQRHAEK